MTLATFLFKNGESTQNSAYYETSKNLIREIIPKCLDNIKESPDRDVCMSFLYPLEKSIRVMGKEMFKEDGLYTSVMEACLLVLNEQVLCQNKGDDDEENGEDDDFIDDEAGQLGQEEEENEYKDLDDEDNQAEHDQLLIEYALNILATTCETVGFENFQKFWPDFYNILKSKIQTDNNPTVRAAAIGTTADIVKSAGPNLANVVAPELVGTFKSLLTNKTQAVRNNSIYGTGILVSVGIEKCLDFWPEILEIYWKLLESEKINTVRDQVLGAVGRMIISGSQNTNLHQGVKQTLEPMVQGLIKALPIQADTNELIPVIDSLSLFINNLSDEQLICLVQNVGNVCYNFGNSLDKEVRVAVKNFVNRIESERSVVLNCLGEDKVRCVKKVMSEQCSTGHCS